VFNNTGALTVAMKARITYHEGQLICSRRPSIVNAAIR